MSQNGFEKFCSKCKINKPLKEFHKRKEGIFNRRSSCKVCRNFEEKLRYSKNNRIEYFEGRIEVKKKYDKEYFFRNKKYKNNYRREKYKNNLKFKLAQLLRTRIKFKSLKSGSTIKDLGCPISEFKLYIENQFESGMSWSNYGKWHLDHVMPLSHFNLEDRMEFLEACNNLNIQPMWAKDNLSKGNRV